MTQEGVSSKRMRTAVPRESGCGTGAAVSADGPAEPPVDPAAGVPPVAPSEPAEGSNRKERVLHTRVPAVLEKELKRFAENLRVPVSNLVRTILEDAMDVAGAASENVEQRLKRAAEQLEHERERLRKRVLPDPLRDVAAFQAVTLAREAACAKCAAVLPPGAVAHLGIFDPFSEKSHPRVFVCGACLPRP